MQADILILVNEYFGTDYGIEDKWLDLFTEPVEEQQQLAMQRLRSSDLDSPPGVAAAAAAVLANGASALAKGNLTASILLGEFPSDDEDDESYSASEDEGKDGSCTLVLSS